MAPPKSLTVEESLADLDRRLDKLSLDAWEDCRLIMADAFKKWDARYAVYNTEFKELVQVRESIKAKVSLKSEATS